MKTILVPTDFSSPAKNALIYAVHLAKKTNAKIIILHVCTAPTIIGKTLYVPHPKLIRSHIEQAEHQLKNMETEIPELESIAYETLTTIGDGVIDLYEIIQHQDVDLTVMGTKGASGLKEIFLGSNTANVIRETTHPVLAIPGHAVYKEIKTIGFAYDGKTITESLKNIVFWVKLFNARLKIFHITDKPETAEEEKTSSENLLNQHLQSVPFDYTHLYSHHIEESINNYIESENIDVLVMIPRKHNLLHRLFKNGITSKIAFHTKVPLLAVPE